MNHKRRSLPRIIDKADRAWLLGVMLSFACIFLAGCPAPTPGERIKQLNARVVSRGDGVVDLDLSGTKVVDSDMAYINAFCSNDPSLNSIHTLDLSDTAITDRSLEMMAMQNGFTSAEGLKELNLMNTNTSDAAIQKFQEAAPDCKIIR